MEICLVAFFVAGLIAQGATAEPPNSEVLGDAEGIFNAARTSAHPEQAIELLGQAAALGHLQAQKMMGLAYHQGRGVSPDSAKAIEWFRAAAAQGDDEAAFNLVA